jgi:hypothetical protein
LETFLKRFTEVVDVENWLLDSKNPLEVVDVENWLLDSKNPLEVVDGEGVNRTPDTMIFSHVLSH